MERTPLFVEAGSTGSRNRGGIIEEAVDDSCASISFRTSLCKGKAMLQTNLRWCSVPQGMPSSWYLGLAFIVSVAVLWTLASVLVQYIFHDLGFQGPFFLTYVGTSLFALNLPSYWLAWKLGWVREVPYWYRVKNYESLASLEEVGDGMKEDKETASIGASKRQTIYISAIIYPLWFIANYTYNQSLNMTSVTSSTVISSTSTIFTFLFSLVVLNEYFSYTKLLGVILCIVGNIVTVLKDSPDSSTLSDSAFGDMISLFSAVMYGVYSTALRRLVPNDDYISMPLFFGYLGAMNACALLPLVVLFHWTGIESLSGVTWEIFFLLIVKGIFDNVISDYLWARAVVLTSPTVATIGLSLTVPFALLSDYFIQGITPQVPEISASFLVLLGFLVITKSYKNDESPKL